MSQNTPPNPNLSASIAQKCSFLPDVLARVDGEDIVLEDLVALVSANLAPQQLPAFLDSPEPDVQGEAQRFADSEVERILCNKLAHKNGYHGSQDDVGEDFDKWLATLDPDQKNQFEESLKQRGTSLEAYRSDISGNAKQQEHLATSKWLEEKVYFDINVSENEIKVAYDHWMEEKAKIPGAVKVAHIPFRHDQSPENRQKAEIKAKEVSAKLVEGADFTDMVREYPSSDGHLQRLGVLDFFTPGTYNEQFEAAAFALTIDEVSPIIDTAEGFEIIKLLDSKKGVIPPLAEVSVKIKEHIYQQKAAEAIGAVLFENKDEYKIEMFVS